jgi:uncharacterized protein DUF4157
VNSYLACSEDVRAFHGPRQAAPPVAHTVAQRGLTVAGLAPSRAPSNTSGTGAVKTAPPGARVRPSQAPVNPVPQDGVDGRRKTSPVLDVVGKGGGQSLAPDVRAGLEGLLGANFSAVRIHTNANAAESAAALGARAYTVGNEVVFGRGSFAPGSLEGQRTLAHELMHVLQQRKGTVPGIASGGGVAVSDPADSFEREAEATASRVTRLPPVLNVQRGGGAAGDRGHRQHRGEEAAQRQTTAPVIQRQPSSGVDFWDVVGVVSPAGAAVGRAAGVDATDVLEGTARAVLGDTLWDALHAFARGFMEGLRNAPKDQLKRISDKFDDFGLLDAYGFAEGYSVGVLKGLWHELTDLFEAIKTLLGLPAAISHFLTQTLPRLAVRLGQLIEQPGGLADQLKRVREAFAKDPAAFMAQVDRLLDTARTAILAEIEKRGQGAASRALSFLDEPWDDIGKDVGELTGRVLFEVLLAVGTDAIGNLIKEALTIAGRAAAALAEGALDVVRGLGKLFGTVLEWLEGLVARAAGQAGELFEALRDLVAGLRRVAGELGAAEVEAAGAGGAGVRMPAAEVGHGGAMEARALERPPGSPTVDDLYGRTPKTTEPKPGAPEPPKTLSQPKPAPAPRVKLLSMGERRTSGAQWFLRDADRAEVAASQRGYQVYEYYDREGRCLYAGKSGGRDGKDPISWVERGWQHIQKERREIAEADRIVVHAELTEQEAFALEQDRISELKPPLNIKEGEFIDHSKQGAADYAANVESASRRPTYTFHTDIVPPLR